MPQQEEWDSKAVDRAFLAVEMLMLRNACSRRDPVDEFVRTAAVGDSITIGDTVITKAREPDPELVRRSQQAKAIVSIAINEYEAQRMAEIEAPKSEVPTCPNNK